MTRYRISILIAAAGPFAAPLHAAVNVQHQAVGCLLADAHPRLEARFEPEGEVARARVFFRAAGTPHWYSVEMGRQAGLWSGVLPKPKRSTPRIEYYLEATDKAFVPARTSEHAAEVATGPGACRKDAPLAASLPSARVVVTAAAGAPAVPAGFLEVGLCGCGWRPLHRRAGRDHRRQRAGRRRGGGGHPRRRARGATLHRRLLGRDR